MAIDYDAWLEQPYQEMYKYERFYERADEEYPKSNDYQEDFQNWLVENDNGTVDEFEASSDFDNGRDRYAEWLIEAHAEAMAEARYERMERYRDDC